MKAFALALLCLSTFVSLSSPEDYCGNFPNYDFGRNGSYKISKKYHNYTYGFSLVIPDGYVAHGEQAPAPHHGFGILLSWEPRAYVYVGADYNSSDYESLDAIKNDYLKWTKDAADHVFSVAESTAKLGSLPAAAFVVRHTCPKLQGIYIDDQVIAWSKDREIIYQAYLLTTETRYQADSGFFRSLLTTWKLSPIK